MNMEMNAVESMMDTSAQERTKQAIKRASVVASGSTTRPTLLLGNIEAGGCITFLFDPRHLRYKRTAVDILGSTL